MPISLRSLFYALLLAATPMEAISQAAPVRDDNRQIRNAVEQFLRNQTSSLPGQASFTINNVEGSAGRAPCPTLDVSMAPGARSIGRTTVLVRCRADNAWAIYVPVQVRVLSEYVVTTRPLSQGQLISEADLSRQSGDLGDLPNGVLLDPALAIGRVAAMPIPTGKPVLSELLRQPPVIQSGQTVKVISRGPGFEVTNEGRALTAAAEGKVIQVRLNSGQVVSGLARTGGTVEISF
ncbi:MAG: flagellar basal body P-ring formation protein FlgA [Rhodocyclaceae bacterium]|nr:flagellar basal body P-ring formation protein FlgA [Rhodocyclaceae bacterium]